MSEKIILEKLDNIEKRLSEQNILNKDVLTMSEACQLLDISASNLYKLTSTKKIPHFCPMGKKLYFEKAELINWMKTTNVKSQNS
jgi:excisionase family DNA binding protein